MRIDSKEVVDAKLVKNVIDLINQFVEQLQTSVQAGYPIIEVRINLKENRVFVVWEDYSEEEQRVNNLIDEYTALKSQLTDPVNQPSLMGRLIEIANEFRKLTGLNIEEVIG